MFRLITLVVALLPLQALAETFVPISPIPKPSSLGGGVATSGGVVEYLNTLFQLSITIGAVLAVIMIAVGGFQYMVSQATTQKADGKARITHALYGLLILLAVTLILYVINPSAICLDIFTPSGCSL